MKSRLLYIVLIIFFLYSIALGGVEKIGDNELKNIVKSNDGATIVVFWATYCPYCKGLLKTLNENSTYLKKHSVQVVAVSVDKNIDDVNDMVKNFHYPFKFYLDKGELRKKYNAFYIPVTVIFDKNGAMTDTAPGYKSFVEIKVMLEE